MHEYDLSSMEVLLNPACGPCANTYESWRRRTYHKINTGPFVETQYGLRLLHKAEVERLMGCEIDCVHYATAIEILGQGVQTRIFREILRQLGVFLSP